MTITDEQKELAEKALSFGMDSFDENCSCAMCRERRTKHFQEAEKRLAKVGLAIQPKSPTAIEALEYAAYLCVTRKSGNKVPTYLAACDDLKIFIDAAIERLKSGEDMQSHSVCQEKDTK